MADEIIDLGGDERRHGVDRHGSGGLAESWETQVLISAPVTPDEEILKMGHVTDLGRATS